MDGREELVLRLAAKRRAKLELSDSGYAELLLAVREDPERFMEDGSDEAFAVVARAVAALDEAREGDDLLDDGEFFSQRAKRMERLGDECVRALALDPNCTEAQLLLALAQDPDPDLLLNALLAIDDDATRRLGPVAQEAGADAWSDVFARGRLRVKAAIARTCLDSARYRMADSVARQVTGASPLDPLGARHTSALALARLEEEAALDALEASFGRRGDSWTQLARLILFYKLGRMGAARRALKGLDTLCEGGVYALLRPVMVDTYLPDRPAATPYSFEEVTLAVHEADPIVVDVPDLVTWVQDQPGMVQSARAFADNAGLEW